MRAQTRKQKDQERDSIGEAMKRIVRPATPVAAQAIKESDSLAVLGRIKLAFLDYHTCEKRGYDPYDTSKNLTPDIWASKRKRA